MNTAGAKDALLTPEFLRKLERLALAARRVPSGVTKGERRSKRKGSSVEFADYRDYVQGDDLRHVDWNIYSRLNVMHLKLFQEQEDLTVHLLIDGSRSMAFGTPPKFDFARQLAATIGYIGLSGYDRVQAAVFSNDGNTKMSPVRGKASAHKFFNFLESATAAGPTQLAAACKAYSLQHRTKGMVLFISDLFDEQGFEDALKHLRAIGPDLYVVQVMAPEELDPQLTGDLKLIDSETRAQAEISVSRALLKRYAQTRDSFVDSVRAFCHRRGIAHFLTPSNASLEQLTLHVLRRAGMFR